MAGQLWGWGNNGFGQLADNTSVNKSSPVQTIAFGTDWSSLFAGFFHVGAIKTDKTLWTWGRNSYGQLGDNTITHRSSPVQTVAGGNNWNVISCGVQNTACIKTDGTLWLWGRNSYGGLGDNTTTNKSSPIQTVAGGSNWISVACGLGHTAAIKADGTLWTWGRNFHGQLGDNTSTNKSSPIQTITGGNNWSSVACGYNFVAAIKTDGTLWLWGQNTILGAAGQLGDNTGTSKSSPVQTITGGNNWSNVDCGKYFTAAVKTDGTLWTWGDAFNGQLGDNTNTRKSSPVQTVAFGTNWSFVTCGNYYTAAKKTDGSLWTWGRNSYGQLGDNTVINKSSPVQTVMGGNRWSAVGTGYSTAAIYENTPSALSITTQPANAYNAQKILNQPVVAVVDSAGNIVTTSQAVITAALASGSPSLTGTTNIFVSGGIAQFTDLTLSGIGSGSLLFTASGLTSAISNYVAVEQSSIAIVPKRSETAGRVPDTTQLRNGELAINIADKKGYVKNSSGSIVNVFTGLGADVITSGMIGENAINTRDIAPGAVGPSELASGVIGGTNTQILYNQSGGIAGTAALTLSTTSGVVTIAPQNAGYNALTLRSFTSQSADLLKVQNSAGTDIARVTSSGEWVGPLGSGVVLSGFIASGQIGVNHLASGVISTAVLGSGQVTSGSIASGSVGQFKLSSGAVNSGHIGNNAVVSGSIASGSIGNFHLASGAVTSGEIGNAAVVSGSIASGSVGTFHIASGSITSDLIASGAVINADVADNAVTSGKIASGSIGTLHISSGGVQNVNIASGAVLSGNIASGQIGQFHHASGSVTSGHIGNAAVVSGSIASGSIGANHLSSGALGVAGSSGQLQFNNGGSLGANAALTYSATGPYLGVTSQNASYTGMVVKGALNQTADILQIQNSSGAIPFAFGVSGQPTMRISNNSSGTITMRMLDDTFNTLSYEGTAGQLFSINNNLASGIIFSVNDISGIPLIDANADATVRIAQYAGNVGIGVATPSGKLHVKTGVSSGKAFVVQGFTSQTANLTEWQNVSGTVLSVVNASGAIGVGTSSPTAFLEVNQSTNKAVRIGDVAGSFDNTSYNPDISTLGAVISLQTGADTTYRNSVYGYQDASANAKLAIFSRSDLVFATYKGLTTDGRSMVIKETTGNVGIGTTTPSGRLTITNAGGGTTASQYLQINGSLGDNSNYPGMELRGGTLANVYPSVALSNGGLALNLKNGYHTTSYPSQQLIDLNAGNAYMAFATSVSGTPSTRMAITNSGLIGIGTTVPNRGMVMALNGTSPQILIYKSPDGTLNANQFVAVLGTGSSNPNAGTSGGNEYGILQLAHNGTNRVQLLAQAAPDGNWILDPIALGTTGSQSGQLRVFLGASTRVGIQVVAATSQTANLQEWQNSAGTVYARVNASGEFFGLLSSGIVTSGAIASGSIGNFHLASGAVTSGDIGNAAVVSGSIASGSVGQFAIASGSITAEHIASGAVISADVADNAVISGKIASGVVAWFNHASGSVRSGHIGDSAVVSGSIASGTIGLFHFASGQVAAGGANGQVQYNSSGALAGAAAMSYSTTSPHVTIQAQNAAYTPLVVKGTTSQTADLLQLQTSTGYTPFAFNVSGQATMTMTNSLGVPISMRLLDDSYGTVSWEGSLGQLFSISNNMTGIIFSVNDISGIPSIDVNSDGTVRFAQYAGNVGIRKATPSGLLDVGGDAIINGVTVGLGNGVSTNTTLGYQAQYTGMSGQAYNVAIGYKALYTASGGVLPQQIVAIGYGAVSSGGSVYNATVVGTSAGVYMNSPYNTAIGMESMGNGTGGQGLNTAVGHRAMYATAGSSRENVAVGYESLRLNTGGSYNVAIGVNAAYTATTAGNVVAVGYQSLYSNTASGNLAVGYQAAYSNTTGVGVFAIGNRALYNNTASSITAIGHSALQNNTNGTLNCAVGGASLLSNTTGSYNTAVGVNALYTASVNNSNTAVGFETLFSNTGGDNTAVGESAMRNNASGSYNTAVGLRALYGNSTGSYSTAVGWYAGYNNNASGLVAIGFEAAAANTTGVWNTAIGFRALRSGGAASAYNTAVGYLSMQGNTGGYGNSAFGAYSMFTNTTGINNMVFGNNALYYNTTGSSNAAFGSYALYNNVTGGNNTALGNSALSANTASGNTAVGTNALYSNSTGTGNVAVGANALYSTTTSSGHVAIGNNAVYTNQTGNSITAVGHGACYNATTGGLTAFGFESLYGTTAALWNTAVGYQSLRLNATGSHNTAMGYQAGYSNTASGNTAIGSYALYSNTSGTGSVAVGAFAGYANTTSAVTAVGYLALASGRAGGTAIGYIAMASTTSGVNNAALGTSSLYSNTIGSRNTALGEAAMPYNTTGSDNTTVGYASLYTITTGGENTAVGRGAGEYIGNGSYNTAVGAYAMRYVSSGVSNNVAIGRYALYGSTGGNNTAVGTNALYSNNASGNTAVGFEASYSNLTGIANTALGYQALRANTGSYSTAIGYAAMSSATGTDNTCVGYGAGGGLTGNENVVVGSFIGGAAINASVHIGRACTYNLTSGSNNVVIGYYGLFTSTNSSNVVAIGKDACRYASGVVNSVYLGAGTNGVTGETNAIALGYNVSSQGSNTTTIGNSSTVSGTIYGNINFPIGIRVNTGSSTQKAIVVQGAASQTANLQEWQNNTGTNLAYMDASGNFYAVSKSFYIDHPTKPGKKLRHVCVEAPTADVYFRGKSYSNIIDLPEYWTGLVDMDTVTVMLTPVGKKQDIWFDRIEDNKCYVGGDENPVFNFVIFGERKDIPKVVVED